MVLIGQSPTPPPVFSAAPVCASATLAVHSNSCTGEECSAFHRCQHTSSSLIPQLFHQEGHCGHSAGPEEFWCPGPGKELPLRAGTVPQHLQSCLRHPLGAPSGAKPPGAALVSHLVQCGFFIGCTDEGLRAWEVASAEVAR